MFITIYDPLHLFTPLPDQRVVFRGMMFVYVII